MVSSVLDSRGLDALLAAARAGDRSAEEALFALLSVRLFEVAKRRIRNEEEARDVAAEALATAWERYRAAAMPGGFLPWLFTILRNKIGNSIKRARTATRVVRFEDVGERVAGDTEDEVSGRRLEERVRGALTHLPTECRRIFGILLAGGVRAELLAAFPLERPGTVDVRLSRCRRRLHEILSRRGWIG